MPSMNIGERLQKLRVDADLDQVQAAKIAGTTKQAVSQIENGRTKVPGGIYLYRWAKFYGVDLEWLILGERHVRKANDLTEEAPLDPQRLIRAHRILVSRGSYSLDDIEGAHAFSLAYMEANDAEPNAFEKMTRGLSEAEALLEQQRTEAEQDLSQKPTAPGKGGKVSTREA